MNLLSSVLKRTILLSGFCLVSGLLPSLAYAKSIDFSGEYLCKGSNETVGDYEVSVTLKKSYRNSVGSMGVYELVTETVNNEYYTGHAVTNNTQIAMTFKLSAAKHAEFSTGIGQFTKQSHRKWSFKHHYFEPDDTGGNYGHEHCVMKDPVPKKPSAKTAPTTQSVTSPKAKVEKK